MIDSHCHLIDTQFLDDLEDVLARAHAAGVRAFVCISDSLIDGKKCLELSDIHQHIYCSIGVHPHNAEQWKDVFDEKMRTMLQSSKKVVAVGEIGLDYYYDNSPRDTQREVFATQLQIANDLKMPVICHCRDAVKDLKSIINKYQPKKLVVHCCTEKWEDVSDLVEKGYLLSFTGIATYPKSDVVRDTIKQCPLEHMMIETDAPYLAPVPYRGKRNESAYVVEVAKLIADLKDVPFEKVDAQTTKNAEEFFGVHF